MSRCCGSRHNFRESGEVNTASNLGEGEGIFERKLGIDLQFKSLVAGEGISLSSTQDEITISSQATVGDIVLNDLTDVTTTTPLSGHTIRYNGSAWVNTKLGFGDLTTGSISGSGGFVYTVGNFGVSTGFAVQNGSNMGWISPTMFSIGNLSGDNVLMGSAQITVQNSATGLYMYMGQDNFGFGATSGYTSTIQSETLTNHRTISFPNSSGTIPVLSGLAAPSTSSSSGTKGEIRVDSGYIYVCIATNSWVRAALTPF